MVKTQIPSETIRAYRKTVYHVSIKRPFDFFIGKRSSELGRLISVNGAENAAFLTAFNPGSVKVSLEKNLKAQKQLERLLDEMAIKFYPGKAIDSAGSWPDEPSVLAFNINLKQAKLIGVRFQQNGIVWIEDDFVPKLLFLR